MKKHILLFAVIIILFAALQTTLFKYIGIMGVEPNLLIVLVMVTGASRSKLEASVIGIIIGIILDSYSQFPFGVYTLLALYLALLSGIATNTVVKANYPIVLVTAFIGTFVYETFVYLFYLSQPFWSGGLGAVTGEWFHLIKSVVILEAVLNTVLAFLVYFILKRVYLLIDKSDHHDSIGGDYRWQR